MLLLPLFQTKLIIGALSLIPVRINQTRGVLGFWGFEVLGKTEKYVKLLKDGEGVEFLGKYIFNTFFPCL